MKFDFKTLIVSILMPVVLGNLVGLITASYNDYSELILPSFAPPGIVFPIVWTILYILMGISSYLIIKSDNFNKKSALLVYGIQLAINLLWSIWFFISKFYLFSFFWIVLLIVYVAIMIKKFYDISKLSANLQIPYLLWLVFAAILNLTVYFLNR